MSVVSFILDGLEAALEVERELGVTRLEFDRSLLAAPSAPVAPPPSPVQPPQSAPVPSPAPAPKAEPVAARPPSSRKFDFVFLHDRPLSAEGAEMMAKIVAAMKRTPETAPVVIDPPVPRACVYVILGARALAKFQPRLRGAPGQWLTSERGAPILLTYSPEYILRFKEVTPAVLKIKRDMWQSLKGLLDRLNSQTFA